MAEKKYKAKEAKLELVNTYLRARDRQKTAWQIAVNLGQSFGYAWQGVVYTFRTERNFKLHLLASILTLGLGFLFSLSSEQMSILVLTCGLVLSMEIVNTAIETVVDLTVGTKYHHLAKVAKDCAAGSVLVLALAALIIAYLLLWPSFWSWLRNLQINR